MLIFTPDFIFTSSARLLCKSTVMQPKITFVKIFPVEISMQWHKNNTEETLCKIKSKLNLPKLYHLTIFCKYKTTYFPRCIRLFERFRTTVRILLFQTTWISWPGSWGDCHPSLIRSSAHILLSIYYCHSEDWEDCHPSLIHPLPTHFVSIHNKIPIT